MCHPEAKKRSPMDNEDGDMQGTPPLSSMLFSPTPSAVGA